MMDTAPHTRRDRLRAAFIVLLLTIGAAIESTAQGTSPVESGDVRDRIERTFREIPGLEGVEVRVANGVARLRGTVADTELAGRASEIARGFDGVSHVVDEVAVTRDVLERITPNLERFFDWIRDALATLPLIVIAIGILVLAWWVGRWIGRTSIGFGRMPNALLRDLVRRAMRIGIVLVGGYFALELIGATALVGALLGTAGVVGLALSFAFRDIIENFLASLILSVRRPFQLRDQVVVAGHSGTIVRMTTSHTELMTPDGNHLRIPNAMVFKQELLNYTRNPKRRFEVAVGVGVDEDLRRAQQLGVELLESMPGVIDDPAPNARVEALGDSNVTVRFYGWVDQREADFLKVRSEATRLVKTTLDDHQIEMPVPIYRVEIERPGAADEPRAPRPRSDAADVDVAHDEGGLDRQVEEEIRSEGGDLLD